MKKSKMKKHNKKKKRTKESIRIENLKYYLSKII